MAIIFELFFVFFAQIFHKTRVQLIFLGLTALLTAKVEFAELKQSIVVSIQFPFALSIESIIPLRVNRKISPSLIANNKNFSVQVSIKNNVSFLSIPGAFIDRDNRLILKLTIVVDDEFA